ncbi:MAG: SEC-C domain-containing protein [Candidatus Eisenbacteria bacterium]|uniref:SEC-C domain-containing protein n=1 Tax=Eiseniibacteriota bacterium TaxID=2212470 RepID=A0A948RZY1_UNCEI|nr:SEC-C domain-containing protein [Candidatus Eisenbacteria bacterium]
MTKGWEDKLKATLKTYSSMAFDPQVARESYTLAMEVREALGDSQDTFRELDRKYNYNLFDWIISLPSNIAGEGLIDEGVELCERYAEIVEPQNFLADRALILAGAGRIKEAVSQVQFNLTVFPDDPWVMIKAADVYQSAGELDRAEELYRRALEAAGDDRFTREGALERLVPMLEEQNRHPEASILQQEEKTKHASEGSQAAPAPAGKTIRREQPKVKRNDPCPCGSGKKYKKCCGSAEATHAPGTESDIRQRLLSALMKFVHRDEFSEEVQRALVLYWGERFADTKLPDAFDQMEPDFAQWAFYEWLIQDYPCADGRSFMERYFQRLGWQLNSRERVHLEKSMASHMGLYQIIELRPDEGFLLQDLLTNRHIEVLDKTATQYLIQWDLVAARLLEMNDRIQFSGGLFPFRPDEKDSLKRFCEDAYAAYQITNPDSDWTAFLKGHGEIYNHYLQAKPDALADALPGAPNDTLPQDSEDRDPRDAGEMDIPPEIRESLINEFLDKHYHAWCDLPVPALKDRTPRAAVQDPEGRRAVIDLIRSMENSETRRELSGGEPYDFTWLWQELGLDRSEKA